MHTHIACRKHTQKKLSHASYTFGYRHLQLPTGQIKWIDGLFKPLSQNANTISDTFSFADELNDMTVNDENIMVSYDVTSLFTNVPLHETINILVEKAFTDNCHTTTYNLNISRQDLEKLLMIATMNQLFQFNGELFQQTDGVALGSPLGSLLANVFLCSIEDKIRHDNLLPDVYRLIRERHLRNHEQRTRS